MAELEAWVAAARHPVEILPGDGGEHGGILIDGGWLRVLGAGSPRLPRSLASWNRLDRDPPEHRSPGALLVADDAVGGFFAVRGGSIEYFAPDTCAWENLELEYGEWLEWAMCGAVDEFYEESRWPGWRDEVRELGGDRAIQIYPPLWAEGDPIARRSRRAVSIHELWELHTGEYATLLENDM